MGTLQKPPIMLRGKQIYFHLLGTVWVPHPTQSLTIRSLGVTNIFNLPSSSPSSSCNWYRPAALLAARGGGQKGGQMWIIGIENRISFLCLPFPCY